MIVNANSIVQHVIQIRNEIITYVNVCKKDYSWNPSTCICQDSKHLKRIVDYSYSKIACDEIIYVTDIVSTNVTSTVSINSDDKKVRY